MSSLYQVRLHFIISLSPVSHTNQKCWSLSSPLLLFLSSFLFVNAYKPSHPRIFFFFLLLALISSSSFLHSSSPFSSQNYIFLLSSFPFSSQIKDPFLGGFMDWDRWVYVLFVVALGLWVEIGVVMGCIWWRTHRWLLGFYGGGCWFHELTMVS